MGQSLDLHHVHGRGSMARDGTLSQEGRIVKVTKGKPRSHGHAQGFH